MKDLNHKFIGACVEGNFLWYVDSKTMMLCKIELLTKQVLFERVLDSGHCFEARRVFAEKNTMLIMSDEVPEVVVYDRTTGNCEYYRENKKWQLNKWNKGVRDCIKYNDMYVFVSIYAQNGISLFDSKNNSFRKINVWFCKDDKIINDVLLFENTMYFLIDNTIIYELKMSDFSMQKYVLPIEGKFGALSFDGDYFWLRERKGYNVYRVAKNFSQFIRIELLDATMEEKNVVDGKLIKTPDYLCVLPVKTETITLINNKKLMQERVDTDELAHSKSNVNGTFSIGNMEWCEKILLFPWASEKLVELDLKKKKAYNQTIYMDFESEKHREELIFETTKCMRENKIYGLKDLLDKMSETVC